MQIPNGMPTLSTGAHPKGSGNACLMEYVSLLAGEEWTDHPTCTNEVLAETARIVNDALDDEERHLLVPLIGRLLGTPKNNLDLNRTLFRVRASMHEWAKVRNGISKCGQVGCHCMEQQPVKAASAIGILKELIDAYDLETGRTEHHQVTDEEYADLALAVTRS